MFKNFICIKRILQFLNFWCVFSFLKFNFESFGINSWHLSMLLWRGCKYILYIEFKNLVIRILWFKSILICLHILITFICFIIKILIKKPITSFYLFLRFFIKTFFNLICFCLQHCYFYIRLLTNAFTCYIYLLGCILNWILIITFYILDYTFLFIFMHFL